METGMNKLTLQFT